MTTEAQKISTPDRERLIRAAIEGMSSLALLDLYPWVDRFSPFAQPRMARILRIPNSASELLFSLWMVK
jgi:hypothetical protein